MSNSVLIIGSTGAIGEAIALQVHRSGLEVYLHGNSDVERLERLSQVCGDAKFFTFDLTGRAEKTEFVRQIGDGVESIDSLVIAVGCAFENKLTHRVEWSQFEQQISLQLKSAHFVLSTLFPALRKKAENNEVRIVVLGSEYSRGLPPPKTASYAAAKAALVAYAKVLSQEWIKFNIRVFIVSPGMVKSKMTGSIPDLFFEELAEQSSEKRLTEHEDIAFLVDFLLSGRGDAMYGYDIPVNRGPNRQ